MLLTCRVV